MTGSDPIPVNLTVNGRTYRVFVEPRRLLSDVLREDCGLTGTHVGCEHGVCGACTILFDGARLGHRAASARRRAAAFITAATML